MQKIKNNPFITCGCKDWKLGIKEIRSDHTLSQLTSRAWLKEEISSIILHNVVCTVKLDGLWLIITIMIMSKYFRAAMSKKEDNLNQDYFWELCSDSCCHSGRVEMLSPRSLFCMCEIWTQMKQLCLFWADTPEWWVPSSTNAFQIQVCSSSFSTPQGSILEQMWYAVVMSPTPNIL